MDKINLAEKLSLVNDHWNPRLIAELDDYEIKVVKLCGEFVWHKHDDADEMFLVIHGELTMDYRDHSQFLSAGEMIVVPKGVEHRPRSENECEVVLFERGDLVNTGDAEQHEYTRDTLERI